MESILVSQVIGFDENLFIALTPETLKLELGQIIKTNEGGPK